VLLSVEGEERQRKEWSDEFRRERVNPQIPHTEALGLDVCIDDTHECCDDQVNREKFGEWGSEELFDEQVNVQAVCQEECKKEIIRDNTAGYRTKHIKSLQINLHPSLLPTLIISVAIIPVGNQEGKIRLDIE